MSKTYKNKHYWIFEPTERHVRVKFGGEFIADSKRVMLMLESKHELYYYFPKSDARMDVFQPSDHAEESAYRGLARFWNLRVGERFAANAAWNYPRTKEDRPDLSEYIAFDWNAMDGWYEEAEEVFVHPRNPYVRVDAIQSERNVRVVIEDMVIAESARPVLVFETGLPTRYYLPQEETRMEYLQPNDTHSRCPYKGAASYWDAKIGDRTYRNIAWGYRNPFPEMSKIKGLLAFYNEKADIYVDGILIDKPSFPSHWEGL